jgi:hypothetical protein
LDEAKCLMTEICSKRAPADLVERYAALRDMAAVLTYQRPDSIGDPNQLRRHARLPDLRRSATAVIILGIWVETAEERAAAA